MTQVLNRLLLDRRIYFLSKISKRFAGHSKWANIKHIKEEIDNKRMVLFYHLKLQMMIAIREGGSTKPSNNLKLSQIIDQAKKANMPLASIKTFLEKMEARKNKTQKGIKEVRGPSGYAMLVSYTTDNSKIFTMQFNTQLKKMRGTNFRLDTSVTRLFIHLGSIIVEKKGDLEKAMEDAINVGAEDVEEFKENDTEYFQFKCDPKLLDKIKQLLEEHQYCILSAEEDYIPQNVVELNESDLKIVSHFREKILGIEDVNNVYDNLI